MRKMFDPLKLKKLRPSFKENGGTVTAGNASSLRSRDILGLAMACSNTFGLVTGALLLGFGLSEIPKSIWKNADWTNCQKFLPHKVAKMAVRLDDAHKEFSNAIIARKANGKGYCLYEKGSKPKPDPSVQAIIQESIRNL